MDYDPTSESTNGLPELPPESTNGLPELPPEGVLISMLPTLERRRLLERGNRALESLPSFVPPVVLAKVLMLCVGGVGGVGLVGCATTYRAEWTDCEVFGQEHCSPPVLEMDLD